MERGIFLAMPAAAAVLPVTPKYKVVSAFQATQHPGMPGPYAGSVVSVKAANSIDPQTEKVDAAVVAEMVRRGIAAPTGEAAGRRRATPRLTPTAASGV